MFSRFKKIKTELKGRNVPRELPTLSIRCIKNCGNQILMNS